MRATVNGIRVVYTNGEQVDALKGTHHLHAGSARLNMERLRMLHS